METVTEIYQTQSTNASLQLLVSMSQWSDFISLSAKFCPQIIFYCSSQNQNILAEFGTLLCKWNVEALTDSTLMQFSGWTFSY